MEIIYLAALTIRSLSWRRSVFFWWECTYILYIF